MRYNMNNDFDTKLRTFVDVIQTKIAEHQKNLTIPCDALVIREGKRYVKVVRVRADSISGGGSAFCFIDKNNGDVLKAASWNAPAKHARGNIFDESNGTKYVGVYGPAYLK